MRCRGQRTSVAPRHIFFFFFPSPLEYSSSSTQRRRSFLVSQKTPKGNEGSLMNLPGRVEGKGLFFFFFFFYLPGIWKWKKTHFFLFKTRKPARPVFTTLLMMFGSDFYSLPLRHSKLIGFYFEEKYLSYPSFFYFVFVSITRRFFLRLILFFQNFAVVNLKEKRWRKCDPIPSFNLHIFIIFISI